jgi:transposase InsO family protein
MTYYITPTEQRQIELRRHHELKDHRRMFFFPRKPILFLDKHQRWRKIAKLLKISKPACQRLEWIIYYETRAGKDVTFCARHFGIARKTFYKWYNRFQDGKNFPGLEEEGRAPKNKRQREITPLQEHNIFQLRKKYIRRSARKLVFDYQRIYGQTITAWKIQKVIEKYRSQLYYHPQKNAKIQRKRKRAQKKKRITELKQKKVSSFLLCLDVIVIYWNGLKRYIFTAIDKYSKLAFAWMYTSKSSYQARDFLYRLHYLLNGKISNVQHDNDSCFEKYFKKACQELNISQYYNRPYIPKDNPNNERFNRTLQEEFLQLGNFTPDPIAFNPKLVEYLIDYDFYRVHQALGYVPPIEFAQKYLKVLPMSSYSTSN